MTPFNTQIEIRQLSQDDAPALRQLVNLFNAVFEEDNAPGSETALAKLLRDDHFVALAAFSAGEVVGGLSAYVLPMAYGGQAEVFLYDLAVTPDLQRNGIGKRLILALRDHCAQNGIGTFFVLANEEDADALAFYHATGGQSERVINFLYETGG